MRDNVLPTRIPQSSHLLVTLGIALVILWLGPQSTARAERALLAESPGLTAQAAPQPEPESPEGGGEKSPSEEFKHSPSVRFLSRLTGLGLESSYWLAMLLNFAVVVAAIVWASKKNVAAMFRNRTASIQKAIEEARQASEDANRRMREVELRLSKLDGELGAMRVAAEKEAAAEEHRIQRAAEEDARRIVVSAEQEITAALRSARRELKGYAADLAVSLAKKQIHVDTSTDQELVHNFARELSSSEDHHGRT
jgi:F-type H+-transporting ATPase subunit b